MSPFSLPIAQGYMAEAVRKKRRCKMNEMAWHSELQSIAPMIAEAWRRKKVQDWMPATPAPAASEH